MVLYFSGTGNSAFVAERIAKATDDRAVNISKYIKGEERPVFSESGTYVFVAPCYVSATAYAMLDFVRSASFPDGIRAWFVITAAAYMGASGVMNKKCAAEKGFRYMGTAQVVMPQNYITYFKTKAKEENRKKIEKAIPETDRLAAVIKRGEAFPAVKNFPGEAAITDLTCRLYYRFFMGTKKFTVSDKCVSCKKCVNVCPLGNIGLNDGRPSWGDNCTHCMACINLCPASAIEYGNLSKGKLRYPGPESCLR